jgi:hypothetical protein
MIVTFEGRMGQGKTLAMTAIAVQHRIGALEKAVEAKNGLEAGTLTFPNFEDKLTLPEYVSALEAEELPAEDTVKVFSTYHLAYLGYEYIDFPKFVDIMQKAEDGGLILNNCLFLLDEAYLFLDSRTSSSKQNRIFNTFAHQTRKRGVDMYLTTHSVDRIDRRVRAGIDMKASCRFDAASQQCRVRFRDMHTGAKIIKRIYGPTIYPFYDTNEIVKAKGKIYRISEEYAG